MRHSAPLSAHANILAVHPRAEVSFRFPSGPLQLVLELFDLKDTIDDGRNSYILPMAPRWGHIFAGSEALKRTLRRK